MKFFKRFALLTVIALSAVCMGIFAAGCGDDNKDSSNYVITVYYSDGTTVVDGTKNALKVQLCDAGNLFCTPDFALVGVDGKAKFDIATVDASAQAANVTNKEYVVHVLSADFKQLELKEEAIVSASKTAVTVILKDVAAPQA